ncbi:EscG/YscG/SsaH family type III secretion system needle protein co-chaperone [Pseudomonas chlororaphis]|uniref:EscG/YscG/SsaH family type III secretion system needle protein co-chaperone n=1 Tax=Pseudomonas chlororaphis TaxID=587753 RepID=UPI0015DF6F60|nr:EscG/YscG/SsaH family type III secretion system needle protein co-chaperone [Pseudomonas chlororaphis]QLL13459.1 EscG/YscG/SsaH family type III secretion system needle protein co-chaperone [Pseudomonas chlororaphis subsp. aurantiaca]
MKTTVSLDTQARRLVVAAGLAASNHGMRMEMSVIRSALGNLIDDTQARRIVEATMLIGIGQTSAARRLLQDDHSAQAQLLLDLLDSERPSAR